MECSWNTKKNVHNHCLQPDAITILVVSHACSHFGLLEHKRHIIKNMKPIWGRKREEGKGVGWFFCFLIIKICKWVIRKRKKYIIKGKLVFSCGVGTTGATNANHRTSYVKNSILGPKVWIWANHKDQMYNLLYSK